MKKKILVVCHGNINRSPLCAAVLAQRTGAEILQAALKTFTRPERAAKKMRDAVAALGLGLDLEDHRSAEATLELVDSVDQVIYMDNGNLKRLRVLAPEAEEKFTCLADFVSDSRGPYSRIPDPGFMAKDSPQFAETVDLILDASLNLANVIAEEGN